MNSTRLLQPVRGGRQPRIERAIVDNFKHRIPWQGKIIAKLVLSHLPAWYGIWRRIGIFKHGEMADPVYAYSVFKQHFDKVEFARRGGGFVALELGVGDSLFSAMIAHAFGSAGCYLVDLGAFARRDLKLYRAMADHLRSKGHPAPEVEKLQSFEELLAVCGARYLTHGIASLRTIPSQAVDFVWSQAVLEHIRRAEFLELMGELRRVIRPDGVCSHRVDLRDHLAFGLNNLRFSERIWEWDFVARSGFYTNRIRFSEMLDLFQEAGFSVEIVGIDRWKNLPTARSKLWGSFKLLPDDELCISGFDVILRPRP